MHEELESYPKEHGKGAYLLKYGTQGVALMHLQPNGQLFSCGGDGTVKCRQLSIRETIVNTKLPWTGFCVDQKNASKWILCQTDCQVALKWASFWSNNCFERVLLKTSHRSECSVSYVVRQLLLAKMNLSFATKEGLMIQRTLSGKQIKSLI